MLGGYRGVQVHKRCLPRLVGESAGVAQAGAVLARTVPTLKAGNTERGRRRLGKLR
jgi:hypothetical protein